MKQVAIAASLLAVLTLGTVAQAGPIVSGSNQIIVEETFANGTGGETGLAGAWTLGGDGSWTPTGLTYQGIGVGGAFTGGSDRTKVASNDLSASAIAATQETADGKEIWISMQYAELEMVESASGSITLFAQDQGPDNQTRTSLLLDYGTSITLRERMYPLEGGRDDNTIFNNIGTIVQDGPANLLVLKMVLSSSEADTVQLWVNPDIVGGVVDLASGDSTSEMTLGHDFQNLIGLQIRPQDDRNSAYPIAWDEIRIEAIPEPMTMSLLGLGGLVALRRRRRA